MVQSYDIASEYDFAFAVDADFPGLDGAREMYDMASAFVRTRKSALQEAERALYEAEKAYMAARDATQARLIALNEACVVAEDAARLVATRRA